MIMERYRLKRMGNIENSASYSQWVADFESMKEMKEYISSHPGVYYVETLFVST